MEIKRNQINRERIKKKLKKIKEEENEEYS